MAEARAPFPSPGRTSLAVVCSAVLVMPVTATGAAEAIAAVGADLRTDLAAAQWVVNAFFLTFAGLMATTGALADRVGRRRMFTAGLVVSTAAMVLAALAPTIDVLILARALAGAGSAAVATGGSALLAAVFPEGPARARAFAMYGTSLGMGLAFGPVISGLLVGALGWRGLFGAVAVLSLPSLLGARRLPESRLTVTHRMDWGGAVCFTLGLTAFALGVVEGPALGWAHPTVLVGFALCVVLLAVFVVIERRHPAPMVDLSLFAQPRFMALCSMPFVLAFGFVALLIVVPPYLMATLGYNAHEAGLALLLLTGPTLVLPPITGVLARRLSQRGLLVVSLLLVAAGTALLALVPGGVGPVGLAGPLLLVGSGFGVSLAVLDGAAVSSVDPSRAGMAAGLFNTVRVAGEVVAIAVLGALLAALTQSDLASRYGDAAATAATSRLLQGDLPGATPAGADPVAFASAATTAYTGALHVALWVLAALSVLGAVLVGRLMIERRANTGPDTVPHQRAHTA